MSWTTNGKRCDSIEDELATLRARASRLEGQIGKDTDRCGTGSLTWNGAGHIILMDKGNIFLRVERLEGAFDQLEEHLGVHRETVREHTAYKKTPKKSVK